MLLKYHLCVVTIISPEPVRTQRNEMGVDRRKIQKELLRGGLRSQESVFRKGKNDIVGPAFPLAKLLSYFPKGSLRKVKLS